MGYNLALHRVSYVFWRNPTATSTTLWEKIELAILPLVKIYDTVRYNYITARYHS